MFIGRKLIAILLTALFIGAGLVLAQSLHGTKTEKNLLASFAGESQARNRYTFFAEQAKNEGFEQIAEVFLETAGNEQAHAKVFFGHLKGGSLAIAAAYPAGTIGRTADNLRAAAAGEKMEWTKLYPEAEKIARSEGFKEIAESFRMIASVERQHEKNYEALLTKVNEGKVFKREKPVTWVCQNCDYQQIGREAPRQCPLCQSSQAFFEVEDEHYD